MNTLDYWTRRAIEREQRWQSIATRELNEKVKLYYEQSLEKIQRDIAALYAKYATENELSMTEARRLIRGDEFRVWRMTLEEYVKASKNDSAILKELNTLAMRSRISRFEALHARTLMEIADLCEKLEKFEDALQYRAYIANYYGNLYDIHKGYGLSTPPVAVDKKKAENVIRTPWNGSNYSTRIWNNGSALEKAIEATMLTAIHRGSSIQKLSQDLSKRMNVAYNNAERLVRTELNYVQTKAAADSIQAAEMGYYQFIAVMDNRTTPMCQSLDGEIFPIVELSQGENAPPMHVRCRSTICASIDDGKQGRKPTGQRTARDEEGKRIKIPADMRYADWKAVYIDKTKTLEDWRKAKDAEYAAQRKNSARKASNNSKTQYPTYNKSNMISKDDYAKLKNLADLNDIALSNIKKFDGSVESIKIAIESLALYKKMFPAAFDKRHKLTLGISYLMGEEDFAITTKGRFITLNGNAYRNIEILKEEYQNLVDEGWFVNGTDWRAIVHHEFGHVIANVYKIDPMKIACEITGLSEKKTLQFITENLSEYAGSSPKGTEIISEVFADMSSGNPIEFSSRFYDRVLEIIQKGNG